MNLDSPDRFSTTFWCVEGATAAAAAAAAARSAWETGT